MNRNRSLTLHGRRGIVSLAVLSLATAPAFAQRTPHDANSAGATSADNAVVKTETPLPLSDVLQFWMESFECLFGEAWTPKDWSYSLDAMVLQPGEYHGTNREGQPFVLRATLVETVRIFQEPGPNDIWTFAVAYGELASGRNTISVVGMTVSALPEGGQLDSRLVLVDYWQGAAVPTIPDMLVEPLLPDAPPCIIPKDPCSIPSDFCGEPCDGETEGRRYLDGSCVNDKLPGACSQQYADQEACDAAWREEAAGIGKAYRLETEGCRLTAMEEVRDCKGFFLKCYEAADLNLRHCLDGAEDTRRDRLRAAGRRFQECNCAARDTFLTTMRDCCRDCPRR